MLHQFNSDPTAGIDPSQLNGAGGMLLSLSKGRSRSEEPINNLAMWSSEPEVIELVKGDRGLGFSILDYQVC